MNNEYQDNLSMFALEDQRQPQLIERYRQRQEVQRRRVPTQSRPAREQGDIRTWWGGRRESTALQQHHARIDSIYHAAQQAAYTQEAVMGLEYHAFTSALQTVAAEERELLSAPTNSLASEVGEQMLLDSVERIRVASTEIQEDFRRRTLNK